MQELALKQDDNISLHAMEAEISLRWSKTLLRLPPICRLPQSHNGERACGGAGLSSKSGDSRCGTALSIFVSLSEAHLGRAITFG